MSETQQLGRYRILGELGHGAMGVVFRAEDPAIGRQVAIKVIRLDESSSPEEQRQLEQSFFREVRAAGGLKHPGIVSIFDAGSQDKFSYIVMELVEGQTLESVLRSRSRLDLPSLLGVCRQASAALDYAHAAGIIHRDIKPANILVAPNGAVKVADFGIAKLSQASTLMLSQTGTSIGTPEFMSPEQVLGKPLDCKSDQWSLAVVAYVVLTGAKPFAGDALPDLLGKVVNGEPTPPRSLNAALPPEVDRVMAKALSKDPAHRYPSCTEFINALDTALQAPAAGSGKNWRGLAAAIGIVVLALAGGLYGLLRHRTTAPPPAEASTGSAETVRRQMLMFRQRPAAEQSAKPVPAAAPSPARTASPPPVTAPAETHSVRLVTNPPNAEIMLDKDLQPTCTSPCTLEMAAGPHTIVARKEGYRPAVQNIDASQPEVEVTLEELTGTLLIQTDPPGAGVVFNGKPRTETTPATLRVPVGPYKVKLTKEGYEAFEHSGSIEPDAFSRLTVTLAKSAGR